MTQQKFKWGILGPGRIAHKFAQALNVIDDGMVYAIASSNAERGQAFADTYGAPKVYTHYEDMVTDPDIDAVYIATPHRFHYDNTMLCLEAGKPVLCEKPLTVNRAESEKLFDTAKAKKLFLMEGVWTLFFPIYQQIRQWLDDGEIGEVKLLTSTFGFKMERVGDDRWLNPDLAGGVLLDMGIYNVAVCKWVLGDPQAITAQGYLGETGVDEVTTVNMHYGKGVAAQFVCHFLSNSVNDFFIYGTKGHIRIHPMFWDTTKATLVTADKTLTVTKPFRANGFEYEIEESMRCVRAGLLESAIVPHANTLATMGQMDEIRAQIGLDYSFLGG